MSLEPVTPMPSVHVRDATEHDIGFLTDVVIVTTSAQNRLPAGFDEKEWRARFSARTAAEVDPHEGGRAPTDLEHGTTYVIEIQGERAGRLRVVRSPEAVEIAGLQLLPAHQGHGIGTHLIEQLVVEAHQSGRRARATVALDNPRAIALYDRLGFVAIGEEDGEALLEAR